MPSPAPRTFLSYSRADGEFVLRLSRDLARAGAGPWLDQSDLQAGSAWDSAIEEALAAAGELIVVLSPDACRSANVLNEVSYALDHQKVVIPLMYRTCDPPLRLHRHQWVDFRGDYARALEILRQRLQMGANDPAAVDGLYAAMQMDAAGATAGVKRPWSRRAFVAGAGGAGLGLLAAGFAERARLATWLRPLPAKRFVAITAWPASGEGSLQTLVSSVMDAIGAELARAEAYDQDLLILPAPMGEVVASMADLRNLVTSMGANLALGIGVARDADGMRLLFQVIDPVESKVLRDSSLRVAANNQLGTPAAAAKTAAMLLDVKAKEISSERVAAGTSNQGAYSAYQAAEAARKEDNDDGLERGIELYKQAIDLDPNYGLAYTKLAWGYLRLYGLHHKGEALDLARDNAKAAIRLDPEIVDAHVALGSVQQKRGDEAGAEAEFVEAIRLDPTDAHTLTYQAKLYRDQCKWTESEAVFSRVLKLRPNYWLARFEYGVMLELEGQYEKALEETRAAALAYPRAALPLENVGVFCTRLGRWGDAEDALKKSYALKSTSGTLAFFSELYRMQRRWSEAISYAEKSVRMDESSPDDLSQLGMVYASAGKTHAEVVEVYTRAGAAQEQELADVPTNGPAWMALALCRAQTGHLDDAMNLVKKAEGLHAMDVDSQLIKLRILELSNQRQESLATLAACLQKAPVRLQVEAMPELTDLRKAPEYKQLIARA